jgi:glycosyltransferase involved in cell wall biosynthesis
MGDLVAAQGIGAVPLPFVNGFCLMIRHDVIQSVGLFDEITFAKGYGEENDYCIRVRNAGWSLVVATDVYIHHAQSKSYSNDRRLRLVNQADEALMRKHDATRDIWPQAGLCRDSLALASSRARIAGALRREDLLQQGRHRFEGKRVGIILPIGERGGGANVILQESLSLVAMGVDVTLFNLDRSNELLGPLPESRILQIRTFASHEALTLHLTNEQRRYDALIATLYCSVYWLPQHSTCRLAYYIQDFEPYFFAIDDPDRSLAMNSYRHGESVRLVTKTRWNQKEVGRHCGRHPLILGPSVDVSAFAPCPFRIGGGPIVVVAMVRPSTPRRAPERTLAVLEKVKARLADRVSVTIFGSLDSELVAAGLVRSWATNAGPLDKARLASLLASADIFLDCSDYQAMGLTALEAMLSGCAVVGPQRGGMNDFVRTGVNGVLADTQDIEACAQALINLVNNDEMRKQISLQAVADANLYIPEQSALNLMRALFDA